MIEKVYGISEDPWPYEYVVNALLFYSLDKSIRDEYLVEDFSEVMFHGTDGDWYSDNALEAINEIYSQIIGVGKSIGEWHDDSKIDFIYLEQRFKEFFDLLLTTIQIEKIDENWEELQSKSNYILQLMDMGRSDSLPMLSCEELLDEYSYGAYSDNKSAKTDRHS